MARSTMLFAPPLPPRTLPAQGTVVIGRSRDADLRLADPDTSRRHAKIDCANGRCVLQDLLSTNGTWVNGERIDEHVLRAGDRIEIGSQEIAFCEVDTEPTLGGGSTDEAQTLFVERSSNGSSFRGNLAEIPTFAVLQILELGRKTGCLHTEADNGPGRIWLFEGAPHHAETKQQRGFDAAVSVVHAAGGRFRFEAGAAAPERTIEASVTELLLEASRLLDESGRPA